MLKMHKYAHNYMYITNYDGNHPVKAIGDQLLAIPGVFNVKTWEWPLDDTDTTFHGQIWVYSKEYVKKLVKKDIVDVLDQMGVGCHHYHNDLYKSGNRRFKFMVQGNIAPKGVKS